MERKRGELVPIGEVFSDLGGPVKALRFDWSCLGASKQA